MSLASSNDAHADGKSNSKTFIFPILPNLPEIPVEIRKLRHELSEEHERVASLTSQLATNSHVVAAFEQSLANMTNRLAHLTATSERKDHELSELRRTIDRLRQSGADAGLVSPSCDSGPQQQQHGGSLSRQMSVDSAASDVSCSEDEGSSTVDGSRKKKHKGPKR